MDIVVEATTGSQGLVRFGALAFECALGKSGITGDKREGDHATPAGRFPLRALFYRADKGDAPACPLPTQQIDPLDGWCDADSDDKYNRYVRLPFTASHETLWRDDDLYDLLVVLGHNDAPVAPSGGSCIFLHVAREDYAPTEGCVALKRADLVTLLSALDADSQINIRLPG